ncbi:MAG TPA: hypothetical protein VF392_07890 [Terracidiphilus sp.]
MNVLNLLVGLNSVILIFLIVNVFKPFFGSYAAKKGENLATKEDIAQITKSQEEIKAQISDKAWDRQRQWEMKRDAVFEVMRELGQLENALLEFYVAHSCTIPDNDLKTSNLLEKKTNWNRIVSRVNGAKFIANTIVSESLSIALDQFVLERLRAGMEISQGNYQEYFAKQGQFKKQLDSVYGEIRKELKVTSLIEIGTSTR